MVEQRTIEQRVCGNCRFLGREYKRDVYDDDGNDVDTPVYHVCELMEHLNDCDGPPKVWPLAGVTDGSGYAASFCVREEFACNQWSAGE
jgi:hypothetical protein